jgi:hypothetical protein
MRKLWTDRGGNDWTTRKENKLAIYDHVRELLCNGHFSVLDSTLWSEMRNCIILNTGQPGHPKGTNDDVLFSFCLAQWVAKENPAPSLYEVRQTLMEEFMSKTRARRIRARGPIPYIRKGQ